eukprot:1157522-Pelagomonas_calceolata.AAC.3
MATWRHQWVAKAQNAARALCCYAGVVWRLNMGAHLQRQARRLESLQGRAVRDSSGWQVYQEGLAPVLCNA